MHSNSSVGHLVLPGIIFGTLLLVDCASSNPAAVSMYDGGTSQSGASESGTSQSGTTSSTSGGQGDASSAAPSGTGTGGADAATDRDAGEQPTDGPGQLYVSTTGSDSNAGTFSSPLLTVAHAKVVVQGRLASGIPDIAVYLRGAAGDVGVYPITSTLSFGPADSAPPGHEVTWTSYPGEKAAWSGGTRISGWSLHDSASNIWQASVAKGVDFREMYVNGVHANRTRTTAITGSTWTRTSTGYVAPNTTYASFRNPSDIEIITTTGWTQVRCKVSSIAGADVQMSTPCWTLFGKQVLGSELHALCHEGCRVTQWVENAYELLASTGPGSWYLDRTADIVYYIPRTGEDMSTAEVIAPTLHRMILGQGASNLTFNRLTFEHTTWLGPDQGGVGYISYQSGYFYTDPRRLRRDLYEWQDRDCLCIGQLCDLWQSAPGERNTNLFLPRRRQLECYLERQRVRRTNDGGSLALHLDLVHQSHHGNQQLGHVGHGL
jgi:hypothetical protein